MNIEQIEQTCAETLQGYANRMASVYVDEPEDFNASVTALLARTLEIHLNRPINLENLYKWPNKQLSEHYRMAHLRPINLRI
jgi:hypothetical protein